MIAAEMRVRIETSLDPTVVCWYTLKCKEAGPPSTSEIECILFESMVGAVEDIIVVAVVGEIRTTVGAI